MNNRACHAVAQRDTYHRLVAAAVLSCAAGVHACDHAALHPTGTTGANASASGAGGSGSGGMGGGPTGTGGAGPFCGDGVKNSNEACDKTDLGGATCASAVAPGWIGSVACTADCKLDPAGCKTPPTTYNAVSDPAKWTSFDVSKADAMAGAFGRAAFDGRYLYLVPHTQPLIARYDTQAAFDSASSWVTYDVSKVTGVQGYHDAAFDGRYLYLTPYTNNSVAARYDTQTQFDASSSWKKFDISMVSSGAKGFGGSAFDGRYVYFVPYNNGSYDGVVARVDTKAPFDVASSWKTFDLVGKANPNAKGFWGTAFDGQYLYLSPFGQVGQTVVARLDTQGEFDQPSSWDFFDVLKNNVSATGFTGVTFDGRYVYFLNDTTVRYDTKAAFGSTPSWDSFDVSKNVGGTGFSGAAFDGRYLLLVPYGSSWVARFDTMGPFTSPSWTKFDLSNLITGAKGYSGAAADGRFIYLAPLSNSPPVVPRFDAKSPSWLPKGWNASFF